MLVAARLSLSVRLGGDAESVFERLSEVYRSDVLNEVGRSRAWRRHSWRAERCLAPIRPLLDVCAARACRLAIEAWRVWRRLGCGRARGFAVGGAPRRRFRLASSVPGRL